MEKYNSQLLKDFLKNNHLSKAAFCKKCGICIETANQFLKNCGRVNVISLVKISNFTHTPISSLLISQQNQTNQEEKQNETETNQK